MSEIESVEFKACCQKCGGTEFIQPGDLEAEGATLTCMSCGNVVTVKDFRAGIPDSHEVRAAISEKVDDLVKEMLKSLRR